MRIVYLYWGDDVTYADELVVSAKSVKFFNPDAYITVLADKTFPHFAYVSELEDIRVNRDFGTTKHFYPKRCVTDYVEDDYMQMDSDTLCLRPLDAFWDLFNGGGYEGFGIIGWNGSISPLKHLSGLLNAEEAYMNSGFHGMQYQYARRVEHLCREMLVRDACPEEITWNLFSERDRIAILGPTLMPREPSYYRPEGKCGASAVIHNRGMIHDAIYRVQSAACGNALPPALVEQLQEYLLSRGVIYPRPEQV